MAPGGGRAIAPAPAAHSTTSDAVLPRWIVPAEASMVTDCTGSLAPLRAGTLAQLPQPEEICGCFRARGARNPSNDVRRTRVRRCSANQPC